MSKVEVSISIIIPVYNSESTISRCINSVVEQTFADWEVIAIDDGSTDSSPEILDGFAKADHRIHVIHKVNSGSGSSRNLGIISSKGKYLFFLDSDDYIEPNTFEAVYQKAEASECDILFFNYTNDFYSNGNAVRVESKRGIAFDAISNDSFKKHFKELEQQNYLLTAWNKFYRRDFVIKQHAEFHTSLRVGEDAYFVFPLYMTAERVSSISISLYHYVVREGSLLHTFSLSRFDDARFVYNYALSTVVKWNHSAIGFFSHDFVWQTYLFLFSLMYDDSLPLSEKNQFVRNISSDILVRNALQHEHSMGQFPLILKTRSFLLLKLFFSIKKCMK